MDGPGEYAALHKLTLPTHDPQLFYHQALSRFVALCDAVKARGTVFVIGRDVYGHVGHTLRALANDGFEIASHSSSHDYQLSRHDLTRVRRELQDSVQVIGEATDKPPKGFRAPGYHVSKTMLDALEELGFVYDSSAFPSAPYYAAKALVLGAYRVLGKPSASLLGSPRLCLAPTQPYTPSHASPYSRGQRAILEVPVSVATPLRLPVTGATLSLAPRPLRALITQALSQEPWVVLNFHGMDLADASELPAGLAQRQPELRVAWNERRERLMEVVSTLAQGRTVAPLLELVTRSSRAA